MEKITKFEIALKQVLSEEGGYSNYSDDYGGETNFGITQNDLDIWAKKLKLPSSVKGLSRENAEVFYKNVFWDRYHYDDIDSSEIATKIFDLVVNLGAHEAHMVSQRAVNKCCLGYSLKVDGILGIKSINAINSLHIDGNDNLLIVLMRKEATEVYEQIITNKPRLRKFENGWLKRANE